MIYHEYEGFASVYDHMMRGVDYDAWADRIKQLIGAYGVSKPHPARSDEPADKLEQERDLVVDLACGTGNLTFALKDRGFDMMGTDRSEEMLMAAREKSLSRSDDILFLEQDMRELDLYCTAGTFVCAYDSFNYLLTDEDVRSTLDGIHNFLYPGGLFIFDFNTLHKYRDVMADTTFAVHFDAEDDADPSATFLWENSFFEEGSVNESTLTFFVRNEDGTYRRFSEIHDQRGFTADEMKEFLENSGLKLIASFDGYTEKEPGPDTERILMVVKKI